MSSVYEVHMVGGGDHMIDILNGIAMWFGTDDATTLFRLALSVGLVFMLFKKAFNQVSFSDYFKYALIGYLVLNIGFLPKRTVFVTDAINNQVMAVPVDNIPVALAVLLDYSTRIDMVLTSNMESTFSTPGEHSYQQSGMMLGSDMLIKASRTHITDAKVLSTVQSFMTQCVFYDLLNGFYTINELATAPDLWVFFDANARRKNRAFHIQGEYLTCDVGLDTLEPLLNAEVSSAVERGANMFYPKLTDVDAKALFIANLPISHETIIGVANDASGILRQTMLINAFYSSVESYDMTVNNSSALDAFVQARIDTQTRATFEATGSQTRRWMVYLKTVFLLLVTGAMIVTAPLAILPGGAKKFTVTFGGAYIWLAT